MKKWSFLLVTFTSIAAHSHNVAPGPTIWYSISEKILKSSQLIITDVAPAKAKKKAPKTIVLKVSTKFQQKDEIVLPDLMTPTVVKNVWFLPE